MLLSLDTKPHGSPACLFFRSAESGNTIEPVPPAELGHQETPQYIQEMSSVFAAVSMRVVLRGQSSFHHNDLCGRLFLTTQEANEMYASDNQVPKPAPFSAKAAAAAAVG